MSLQSFVAKLIAAITSLFKSLPADIREAVKLAVTITANIKTVVDNPAADILTAIIPGGTDDAIVLFLRGCLPEILAKLKLLDNKLSDEQNLNKAIAHVQTMDDDTQHAFLHSIAVLLTCDLVRKNNFELSWSDAVFVVEWHYRKYYKKDLKNCVMAQV